ncbi:MAG: hypothetical protein P8N23_01190 [Methylophilaceae bacterium]|nr:hypothetical protein [Methylophilaceae bacterium]
MKNLAHTQCPKYQQCWAPICPLDEKWQKRKHIGGDRVCFYLTEAQKPDANAVFEVRGLGYLYEVMVMHTHEISSRHHTIKKALINAKTSSSRMARKVGANHE